MAMKNIYKKWTSLFLFFSFISLFFVGIIDWYIDPLWCFNHSIFSAVQWRKMFNERQQKTNLLVFRKPVVRTLVTGTSRMMYIDPNVWGREGFNYGVSRLMPIEYKYIIRNVKKATGTKPERVILGIDYLSCSKTQEIKQTNQTNETHNAYHTTQEAAYRFKSLFSITSFKASISTFFDVMGPSGEIGLTKYSTDFMSAEITWPSPSQRTRANLTKRAISGEIDSYRQLEYDEQVTIKLRDFVYECDGVVIIPLMTPMGTPLLRELAKIRGRIEDNERFLRECVGVFGGVWDFMYVNSVTSNPELWYEPSHHLAQVNEWMADRIYNRGNPPADFGVYVTKENIDQHLASVKKGMLELIGKKDAWNKYLD